MNGLLKNKKVVIMAGVIVVVIITVYFLKSSGSNSATVIFSCKNSKSITARFDLNKDKEVSLKLSDGRTLSVPLSISASGARYANKDETFVFWNKGNSAFITEGKDGLTTYEDCVIDGGMASR